MIAVLTSGISLGHYVPAVLLERRWAAAGLPVRTFLHEDLLGPRSREGIGRAKRAYHQSFRFALMAQKVGSGIAAEADPARVRALLDEWSSWENAHFVVLSGYWVPILRELTRGCPAGRFTMEHLHVDSSDSPSWAAAGDTPPGRHAWLFSWSEQRVVQTIPAGAAQVPFGDRERRLVIHGGGWGIGSYRDFVWEGLAAGFACDVRRYFTDDVLPGDETVREILHPDWWEPWSVDAGGRHTFPPVSLRTAHGEVALPALPYHPTLELIRGAVAVVSKPGGATLLDSIEAATPVVFLPPYGEHEAKNLQLWERLGFGVTLQGWRDSGFSVGLLQGLHANLLTARRSLPSYPERYLSALRAEGAA